MWMTRSIAWPMTGVPRLRQVERRAVADLADHNAVRPQAQRIAPGQSWSRPAQSAWSASGSGRPPRIPGSGRNSPTVAWLRVPRGAETAHAYQTLQTLVGAWPLDLEAKDETGVQAFAERVGAWQIKALRESELRTSWTSPDTAYEDRCRKVTESWLADREFRAELHAFVEAIACWSTERLRGTKASCASGKMRCAPPPICCG